MPMLNYVILPFFTVWFIFFVIFSELQDKRLFAPIHCASQTGNVDTIETLLQGGSCVNSRGFAGTTPLHVTVSVI